jgi:hypothetical protein
MRRTALLVLPLLLASCEPATEVTSPIEPAFAPGGNKPPTSTMVPSATTIHDVWQGGAAQTDVRSDGSGAYVDAVCGVRTWIVVSSDGSNGGRLLPHESSSSCPRSVTLRLVSRHVTNDDGNGNHVDDASSPLGEFDVGEIKMILSNGVGVVNAPTPVAGNSSVTSCFEVSRNGRISGQGLRFDAANFPGSNWLVVETITPNSHYRIHTAPYPNDLAYCKNNNGVSFWHVVVDLELQAISS